LWLQSPAESDILDSHLPKLISSETTNQNMAGKNHTMGQQRHHKDLSKCHIIFHLSLICSVLGGCFSHCHPKIFREQSGQFSFEDPNHSSTIPPGKDRWLATPNVLVYHGRCWELRHLPFGTDKVSEVPGARRRKL